MTRHANTAIQIGQHFAQLMKIAIAGLGHAGAKIHLPAIQKIPELEVVGAIDPNPIPFESHFPIFSTLEHMLDSTRLDIIIVATPTEYHFDQCKAALEHGCHVLCEKPFVDNLRQAKILSDLADERNLRIAVNNQFRFMRIHQAAKSWIGNKDFGALLFADMQQTFRTTAETERFIVLMPLPFIFGTAVTERERL